MRYDALDSWRGICAIMVSIYHFAIASHFYSLGLVRNAFLFVDFFFVLSGFVISINYESRLREGFGTARFMLLRFGRVWPLHAFMLGMFVLLEFIILVIPAVQAAADHQAFGDAKHSPQAIITNLLLIHSLPGVHEDVTWNGPSWSISVEFYTYLIFAVGLMIVSKLPKPDLLLVLGIIGIMVMAPIVIYLFGGRSNIFLTTGGGLLRCLYGFAAGVAAAKLFTRYREPILKLFSDRRRATLIESGVLLAVLLFVGFVGISSQNLVAPYLFLVVILTFAPQAGAISSFLCTKPMLYIGALSYSIYMVHYIVQAILYLVHNMILQNGGPNIFDKLRGYEEPASAVPMDQVWAGDLTVILGLAVIIGLSSLTYRFIEQPGRNAARRLSKRWKDGPVSPKPWRRRVGK